jgi:NAD(P)-dependent dehydrogenase (short-subunit alcohol dehydrogenase family)
MVTIANKAVLVTGANRGIGRALVEEALSRGARQVYAGTRQAWTHPDPRVTPLTLDVTDAAQIQAAAAEVASKRHSRRVEQIDATCRLLYSCNCPVAINCGDGDRHHGDSC